MQTSPSICYSLSNDANQDYLSQLWITTKHRPHVIVHILCDVALRYVRLYVPFRSNQLRRVVVADWTDFCGLCGEALSSAFGGHNAQSIYFYMALTTRERYF